MTSRPIKKTPATRSADRFPEFSPRDDMQNSIYLDAPAHQAALSHHFGRPDTTIILKYSGRPDQTEVDPIIKTARGLN